MADRKNVKRPLLLSSLLESTETVILRVRSKRKEFVIHKQLLITSSEFFRADFCTERYVESKDGIMDLPDDHPGAVALFPEWLYSGRIESTNKKSRLDSAFEVYILATKFMITDLMNEAMSTIQDMSFTFAQYVDPKRLAHIYEGTPQDSRLRQFGLDSFLFGRFQFTELGISYAADYVTPFTNEEMKLLWEVTRDKFDLYQDLMEGYRDMSEHLPSTGQLDNPAWTLRSKNNPCIRLTQEMEDNYEWLTCKYHVHSGIECVFKDLSRTDDWVDDGEEEEL